MILIGLCIGLSLGLLALAARPLGRYRARVRAERRDSFHTLLKQAEEERIRQQVEAEGDQIPW